MDCRSPLSTSSADREAPDLERKSKRLRLEQPPTPPAPPLRPSTLLNPLCVLEAKSRVSPLSLRAFSQKTFSVRQHTSTFASHDGLDIFRCTSSQARIWSPPFSCAFNTGSKTNAAKNILAVGDEEGVVTFIDADRDSGYDSRNPMPTLRAHWNAIFELRFSPDDSMLATGSGDQTCKIFTTRTQQHISSLVGHSATIKQCAWDPSNSAILSTASRDGSICIWDLRISPGSPVNRINNAHGARGTRQKRSAARSVTSVVYLPNGRSTIASSGSVDGVIRLWDLRKAMSKRVNPPYVDESTDAMLCGEISDDYFSTDIKSLPNKTAKSRRLHGISNLVLSEPNGRIYALKTNSTVVAHSTAPGHLFQPEPLQTFSAPGDFISTSFYVRMDTSPCGRFLLSGSSSNKIWIWDTLSGDGDAVSLSGHTGEVGPVAWGNRNLVSSAGDDWTVRLWRPQERVVKMVKNGDNQLRWKWSGNWEPDGGL